MGEPLFDDLFRFFKALSVKSVSGYDLPVHQTYATAESIKRFLPEYLGHKSDFLGERLHFVITRGQSLKRIYFIDFISIFYMTIWPEDRPIRDKLHFIFRMMDLD